MALKRQLATGAGRGQGRMPAAGSPGDPGVQGLGAVLAALPSVFSCILSDLPQ